MDTTAPLNELTVRRFHHMLSTGDITAAALTAWYLDRIDRLDGADTGLNAVVTVNPLAREEAARLDEHYATTGSLTGPLHGVPVLVKDQAETAGIPTAFGSTAFAKHLPKTDATVVRRLKEAGAVIIAKTTMCDFAAGWFSSSSRSGWTRNAYDTARDSGGSSAGTGTGVSANLGLVGVGEDTGGSIRIPAAFNNIYGLRVTTGLISRTGFAPLVHYQDTPGPMARTVEDLALLLDSMVGYDPEDPYTAVAATAPEVGGYLTAVDNAPPLHTWQLGVLETAFGADAGAAEVTRVINDALALLVRAGAHTHRGITLAGLRDHIAASSVYVRQSRSDLNTFTTERSNGQTSFDEIVAAARFDAANDLIPDIATGPDYTADDIDLMRRRLHQDTFRRLLTDVFARTGMEAMLYPTVQIPAPTHAAISAGAHPALTFPTNTVIASQAGFPAITVPAGFTSDGLPVGLEILAPPHHERRLLQIAAAIAPVLNARQEPQVD